MTRLFCLSVIVALATHLSIQAQEEKDPAQSYTNSIGMKFAWIPPGSFMMGSPKEEKERRDDETQHMVTLTKGFYMGIHLVTQEQWKEVMGKNPSHFQGEKNLPVEKVSWISCQHFCKKLQKKDGREYRLPTEAEWEYACRAGTATPFHFGDTISIDQANYNGNITYGNGKTGVYRMKTTPVGSFPANAWGLYDMHGNVYQWCKEWAEGSPQNDRITELFHGEMLRGGSWNEIPQFCRSAFRNRGWWGSSANYIGFRVCFSLESRDPRPIPFYIAPNLNAPPTK